MEEEDVGRCVALQVKRVVEEEAEVEGRLLGRSAVGSLTIFFFFLVVVVVGVSRFPRSLNRPD